MDRPSLLSALEQLNLKPTGAQFDGLETFEENLYTANEVMNLTRILREDCWSRHFLDSVLFHDLIPEGSSVLDIGTGAGMPAWPLACLRPDLTVTALDSNGKAMGFLKANLLPNLKITLGRAEDFTRREAFDVVTGRALAPLAIQLEVSAAPCKLGGLVLPMRTPADVSEMEGFQGKGLGLALERIEMRPLAATEVVRAFPIYRKVEKTDRAFPRSWTEIKRKPLK